MSGRFMKKWAKNIPLKIKLLFGIVIILGLIILGIIFFPDSGKISKPLLPGINTEEISQVELIRPDKILKLTKNEDKSWILTEGENEVVEADSDKINQLLNDIGGIKKDLLVSNNADKQDLFMVGPTGLEVKLYAKDQIVADFFAGKPSANWAGQYFRLADSDEIVQYNQNLLMSLEQDFAAAKDIK